MQLKKPICFSVDDGYSLKEIETFEHEYRNLMVLLNEKIYLENFGECGGQGKCATCAIMIESSENNFTQNERNEFSTLSKAGLDTNKVRLSCQIFIDEKLNGAQIVIYEEL